MDPVETTEQITAEPGRGPSGVDDGVAEPGLVCGGIAVGFLLAALLSLLNARLNPATYRPGPMAEPRPALEGPPAGGTVLDVETVEEVPPVPGLVHRLRERLGKSRAVLQERFDRLFGRPVDDTLFDSLEEALLTADVGVSTTERIVGRVREQASRDAEPAALRAAMQAEMLAILGALDPEMKPSTGKPWVLLVVGVNGSGKTTTIGKLAARFQREGKKVMLAAADTFRAAAADQLKIWAERSGADIVAMEPGADPGAVVYDALAAARARGHDVVIIDTAGRLQTARPLMEQLAKIRRVIAKQVPDGPHETLLVLDGTMGQNALSQAQLFDEATPLTGVVVTKLDGTAKGGMILTIASEMNVPIKLIGIGEGVDDLRDFEPSAFVEALG